MQTLIFKREKRAAKKHEAYLARSLNPQRPTPAHCLTNI